MLPAMGFCPFTMDFTGSRITILMLLGMQHISQQSVAQADFEYGNQKESDITSVVAGDKKYFGLGYLAYCAKTYKPEDDTCFEITWPMAVEAMMYYGEILWNDTVNSHPSIEPFRRVIAGEKVKVKLTYHKELQL